MSQEVRATAMAMVASRYYLDYRTMKLFRACFGGPTGDSSTLEDLCRLLADAHVRTTSGDTAKHSRWPH